MASMLQCATVAAVPVCGSSDFAEKKVSCSVNGSLTAASRSGSRIQARRNFQLQSAVAGQRERSSVRSIRASGVAVASADASAAASSNGAAIQFIRGIDEQSVPDVRLTRSRDGTNGTAIFSFDQPSVFDSSRELGDITGLYLIDTEGIIQSVDVSAKFVNGKPARIEAKHIMTSLRDWDRFMRFMERYAEKNNLGFTQKQ
eukprot:TRINITY_DN30183_c0_g1_i1.p1 TRINITY_DN30183_c0_g1~~TRINITY_DN30183_c0_g1_i1.p1  ORF type:complete len:201 (-),score=34.50 TRINITY_DN30183_c0_g1_i1:487-1089(-)